ncbi:alpha/beta-hydrolase [Stipitochalara longipes BDJ]|nr:alpha/beta-hydrolase [Stipitochalara longipes BDJ]
MFELNIFGFILLYSMIATCVVAQIDGLGETIIFPDIVPSINLTWSPCFDGFNCSRLDVPLDYLKLNGSRSSIPLVKMPAAGTPYKGMLLTNPGGPGSNGIEYLRNAVYSIKVDPSLSILQTLHQNYDLVSWDVRGVGLALPGANCNLSGPAISSRNATISSLNRVKKRSLDKIYGPPGLDFNFTKDLETRFNISVQCQAQLSDTNEIGSHMSTASVAQDLISILDAFARSEDGSKVEDASLLNYWGISYGTFIGETFSSMFPDRVGRVALDAVMDPYDWVAGNHFIYVADTDDLFSTFFLYCHLAGSSVCPFYTGSSAHDIYLRFESMISKLNSTYAMEQGWQNATDIDTALKFFRNGVILQSLYHPILNFPYLAQGFADLDAALMNTTNTTLENQLSNFIQLQLAALKESIKTAPFFVQDDDQFGPENPWYPAVACLDNGGVWHNLTHQELFSRLKALQGESYIGGLGNVNNALTCVPWQILTDDRYAGPFGGKTKNPVLFVSNVLDPVTAIANGRKGAAMFDRAELLTVEAIGHSSLLARNRCAFSKIVTFFINGTLPGEDNYCGPDAGPWNITIPGTLKENTGLSEIKRSLRALRVK